MRTLTAEAPMPRLTVEQICQVPKLLKQGYGYREIADMFGVSSAAIRNLTLDKRWERYTDSPEGVPDRCPDCGGLVADDSKPCLRCQLVALKRLGLTRFEELG